MQVKRIVTKNNNSIEREIEKSQSKYYNVSFLKALFVISLSIKELEPLKRRKRGELNRLGERPSNLNDTLKDGVYVCSCNDCKDDGFIANMVIIHKYKVDIIGEEENFIELNIKASIPVPSRKEDKHKDIKNKFSHFIYNHFLNHYDIYINSEIEMKI